MYASKIGTDYADFTDFVDVTITKNRVNPGNPHLKNY